VLTESLREPQLHEARRQIYLGQGYYVLRGFLDPAQVAYILAHWSTHQNDLVVSGSFKKAELFYTNCPNYSYFDGERSVHFNFFWNRPSDLLTYETSWRIQRLRNQIEGTHASDNYMAHAAYGIAGRAPTGAPMRAVSHRVVGTKQGGGIDLHRDWLDDPSKVQMSLCLTARGEDYLEGGLLFRRRDGTLINICAEECLQPGDLVVFRYCHEHGVEAVTSSAEQQGFWRILFPIESIRVGDSASGGADQHSSALRRLARVFHRAAPVAEPPAAVSTPPTLDDPQLRRLAEIAVDSGCAPSDVFYPKGLFARWHQMQRWQVETLVALGLKPQHKLLDVGCGVLRLGLELIPFLDDGNYFGTDPVDVYVATAHRYASEILGSAKRYHLMVDRDFEFEKFGARFDFAVAHSVFTHMTFDEIRRCLGKLSGVMADGGKLVFTLALNPAFRNDYEESFLYNADIPMVRSYHADLSFFEGLSRDLGFELELPASIGHPSQTAVLATFGA
jgi:SAM-dependent methyltransferase